MATGEVDEESKSYSAVFLLAVGLLLVGSLWSIWDDNIARRPWKKYQAEFFEIERAKAERELVAEGERLAKDPGYQELTAKIAAAKKAVATGETEKKMAGLQADLKRAQVRESEWDLKIRIVKSEIEEARYEYEHAVDLGRDGAAEWKHLGEKEAEKKDLDEKYKAAQAERAAIEDKIKDLTSEGRALEDKLRDLTAEREKLSGKLDGLTINFSLGVTTLRFPRVPKIEQVVLAEYDRNAYDQPVGRVDRCQSCHSGIDKAGFDDQPQPFRTHPDRQLLLGSHPPDKFGCTPCHGGQGAGVNSPEIAHGEVPYWERPLLRGEKLQARCIACHAEVHRFPHAERIAGGEKFFEQLGCHGCHLVEGYDGLPKVGPSLRSVAAKNRPEWMVSWVAKPQDFRPRTKMPWFLLSREQSQQMVAYLWSASQDESGKWLADHSAPPGVDSNNPALVAEGKALTESVGCRACHAFSPEEVAAGLGETKDIVPNLSRIGEKTDARWLYNWVKNPRGYNPTTRMPSLRLTDGEAAAITSYLLTLRSAEAVPDEPELRQALTQPENIEAGKALIRKYGCFGCHDIPGMEKESRIGVELTTFGSKGLEELFFGDHKEIPRTWEHWTFNKLKNPRVYQTKFIEQLMPNFRLADSEIRDLRIFLASRIEQKVPSKYRAPDPNGRIARLVDGRRLVEQYNCFGCHIIDKRGGTIRQYYTENPTLAPPILNGEGAKVQADWLYSFLKNPISIRPWLKVRMPTFGFSDEETRTIVEYFDALDDVKNPFVFVNETNIPRENLEAARKLTSKDYFACFSCHQQGDRKPEGPPEGWAPDLTMARQRLNPDWIVRWITDPQKLLEGTKMPSFYPGGPDDVFGGNDQQQIEALRDYIMVLSQADALLSQKPVAPAHAATGGPGAG